MDRTAKDREEKALRFATFCGYRFKMDLTEDQIATELGFRSPEALYKQLELDGSPVCGVCGLLYPEAGHPKEHERKRQPKLNTETWIKLPNAMNAGGPFRKALKEYDIYLDLVGSEDSWLRGKSFRTYIVEAAREGFVEAGMPDWLVDHLIGVFGIIREGALEQTTDTVCTLTGSEPRTFAQFARKHAGLFQA